MKAIMLGYWVILVSVVLDIVGTGYEKPHPEAYRRVLRTLDDEVEAGYGVYSAPVGRRSEYRNSASATAIKKIAEAVTTDSRPVSPCRSQEKPWR